jgi:hypothetical protein
VFTARYALSPYIKQIRFVFKGLITINTFTSYRFRIYLTTINSCYWLKCPTLFRSPPISSFVPTSKWMCLFSYFSQKRLPPVRQTFVYRLNFYRPPPLFSTSHPLYFYFLPSSYPCHIENPRMEDQRVLSRGEAGHTHVQTIFPSVWQHCFDHRNNICWCVHVIWSLVLCSFRWLPVTSCLLRPNIYNTPFLDSLRQCSLLNVRDRVSHPCKTSKIIGLCNLIRAFLHIKRGHKTFWIE